MNVVAGWLATPEWSDAALMVKLNEDNGTVDPVVIDAFVRRATKPSEIGSIEMPFYFYARLEECLARISGVIIIHCGRRVLEPIAAAKTSRNTIPACFSTFYLASTVIPSHSSVRNGVSGNPELLNMLTMGFSAQP